jgi:hypothetical protein
MGDSDVDLVGTEQDDALLAELRAAASLHDGVPPAVADAARASFTWRTIDAELAALAFDSLAEAGALVRGGAPTRDDRLLTFETADVSVDVEISGTGGDLLRLTAQVVPAGPAEVSVRTPGGEVVATTDQDGRLAPMDVARGPISLRVRVLPDGPVLVTEWVNA